VRRLQVEGAAWQATRPLEVCASGQSQLLRYGPQNYAFEISGVFVSFLTKAIVNA